MRTRHRVVLPDGRIRWTDWTQTGIFDDKGVLLEYQAVGRDVTERKQAEQALIEAEHRYREFIRLAPAGIYEIDFRTRRYVSVNDSMCEMLGYSREELLAMDPLDINGCGWGIMIPYCITCPGNESLRGGIPGSGCGLRGKRSWNYGARGPAFWAV